MTPKQQRFVDQYLVDLNATAAARRAGYSHRTAAEIGHENLIKPEIQVAIETAQAERAQRTRIDADWVILRAVELVERCMQHEPVRDADGEPTGVYRFDSAGAVRGLALLAKHTGAFTERIEHNAPAAVPIATVEAQAIVHAAIDRVIAARKEK